MNWNYDEHTINKAINKCVYKFDQNMHNDV